MKKEEIDKLTEDIIDVVLDHQYDLSDGFAFYSGDTVGEIMGEEIKAILRKAL